MIAPFCAWKQFVRTTIGGNQSKGFCTLTIAPKRLKSEHCPFQFSCDYLLKFCFQITKSTKMSLKGLNFETFFRDADVNNDGHLSLQELIVTLRKYGYKKSDAEIKVSI